jgi:hypothetical protein
MNSEGVIAVSSYPVAPTHDPCKQSNTPKGLVNGALTAERKHRETPGHPEA